MLTSANILEFQTKGYTILINGKRKEGYDYYLEKKAENKGNRIK